MRRLLLTVEDTFPDRGRGILMLAPWLVDVAPAQSRRQPMADLWPDFPRVPSPRPTQVELRLPDGTTRMVACRFADSHVNWEPFNWESDMPPGPKPPWVVACGLLRVSRADVPAGTQVWYDTDDS